MSLCLFILRASHSCTASSAVLIHLEQGDKTISNKQICHLFFVVAFVVIIVADTLLNFGTLQGHMEIQNLADAFPRGTP